MAKVVWVKASNIDDCLRVLLHASTIGFDTETTSLHPRNGKLRLIQLAVKGDEDVVYMLDCFKANPQLLAPVFSSDSLLIGHNLVFDLSFLWSVGIRLKNGKHLFDTMIAGQLLEAGLGPFIKGHFSLEEMLQRYLRTSLDKTEQTSDWSGTLRDSQIIYAAKDALTLLDFHKRLLFDIQNAELTRTMKLEMRCLPGMVWLNVSGMPVDKEKWNALAIKSADDSENLEYALADLTGTNDLLNFSRINWRSTQQVVKLFQERGIQIEDSDSYTLGQLAVNGDPLAKMLLKHREVVKRRDTYGLEWSRAFINSDGRVYANWHQVEARTGRQSCSGPNLQNIPHSREFRACFIPNPGYQFTIGDYSQVEFRIAVELTMDKSGLKAYCVDKTDAHTATAILILGDASSDARKIAKSLNFGLIFGSGAETMRQYAQSTYGVSMTLEQAEQRRDAWRAIYREIVAWHKKIGREVWSDPIVSTRTMCGRRRLNVDKYSIRLNTPVQGTGTDALKAGIALCYENRHKISSLVTPAGYVHDELIFHVPKDDAEEVAAWQRENMERGLASFLKIVPSVAEVNVAQSWADK